MQRSLSIASRAGSATLKRRCLHGSASRLAVSSFRMPAMSPTMTEGGIASWKKKEGEAFSAGDVLLEIETDKATIDVEAQDDGVMGKILAQDGAKNVKVGKVIALLAEEGDDISSLEAPKEEEDAPAQPPSSPEQTSSPPKQESSSQSTPPAKTEAKETTPTASHSHSHNVPKHSRPLFPSVLRLLQEHGVEDPEKIKGTGVRGMLTKGDVLAFLGKASGPTGSYKEGKKEQAQPEKKAAAKEPLDGPALRRLIVSSLLEASKPRSVPSAAPDFDSIISDYLGPPPPTMPKLPIPPPPAPTPKRPDFLDGLI